MANSLDIELHDLGEETTSGASESVDIGELRSAALLVLKVPALSGGSFTFEIQTGPDDASWRTVWSKALSSTSGKATIAVDGLDQYVRARWVVPGSGTPAVTFSIAGTAHTLYAEREDLQRGELPAKATTSIDDAVIVEALVDASNDAEDALAASNALPLTAWPSSLSRRCAAIASYQIMKNRGFKPDGFDDLIVKAHDDAQKWLKDVAAGRIRPPGLAPATELGPKTSSGNPRRPTTYKRRFSDDWGDFG